MRGAKGSQSVQDIFFLLLLPSHVFPLLWHKFPTDRGPALEQALQVVQFLQGISTWLGSSLVHPLDPFSGITEHLCPSPLTLMLFFCSVSHSFCYVFYFVLWHFLPFLKSTFPEVLSVLLRGWAMSGCGTVGTSWAWAGQPLAFSHQIYSCSPSAASTLLVITSTAGFSKTVAAGIEIIMLPWRSQRCSPWIVCSLFCAVLKCSVFAAWVSLLEWNWEKPQVVRNKISEQFSLMKLYECSQLV